MTERRNNSKAQRAKVSFETSPIGRMKLFPTLCCLMSLLSLQCVLYLEASVRLRNSLPSFLLETHVRWWAVGGEAKP